MNALHLPHCPHTHGLETYYDEDPPTIEELRAKLYNDALALKDDQERTAYIAKVMGDDLWMAFIDWTDSASDDVIAEASNLA